MSSAQAAIYSAASDTIVFSNSTSSAHTTSVVVGTTSVIITDNADGKSLTFGTGMFGENDFVFPDGSHLTIASSPLSPPVSPPPPPPVSPPPPPPQPISSLPTSLPIPNEPAAPTTPATGAHGSIIGNMDASHLADLFPAVFTAASDTEIAARGAGGLGFDLTGTGFTYSGNQLVAGSANFFVFDDVTAAGAVVQFAISLPGISVAAFETWLAFDQTQVGFQTILAGADVLSGGPGADVLHSYGGADLLYGGGGHDSLFGGDGDDVIYAGFPGIESQDPQGSSYIRGEQGDDYIVGGPRFDDINGNQGNDTIDGGSGGDDWLVGGQGNDLIFAHHGQNILYGNLGNDSLVAGGGGDLVRGGQGDDVLWGGAGNDWLSGDRGNDTIIGGAGADIFHTFSGAGMDRVLDFHVSEGDRVQLDPGTAYTVSQVGADTVIDMGAGDQMILVGVQLSSLTGAWIFGA